MTVRILTKLAFQQSLKIVVSTAYVARFIIGVLELLLVYTRVLDLDSFALASDLVERSSAIRAFVGELRGLSDALQAKDMVAGQFSFFFLVFLVEISQAYGAVLSLAAILFTLNFDPVRYVDHLSETLVGVLVFRSDDDQAVV
jgi:hypothetical protein